MTDETAPLIHLPTALAAADRQREADQAAVVLYLEALLARARLGQLSFVAVVADEPSDGLHTGWQGIRTGAGCRDAVAGLAVLQTMLVGELVTRFAVK